MGGVIVCGVGLSLFALMIGVHRLLKPRVTFTTEKLWTDDGYYKHVLPNGRVVWYKAPRYAVDDGRTSAD